MATSSVKPQVELTFSDITSEGLQALSPARLGNPSEVIQSALMGYRLMVINHVKTELGRKSTVTGKQLLALVDLAGQIYLNRFNQMVGPVAAEAYISAYRAANAGDVPTSVLYALAEQHTTRIGNYYNETSKEALAQGFNTFVNRKMPQKVAADRVMDAFGLTPRQMTGYTSIGEAKAIASAQPMSLKGKALTYIQRSLRTRFKSFADQEEHNLTQQATQTAWMWLQDKGSISEVAQKVWLTARDERVCPQCGPLHGKKVGVKEQFELPGGHRVYVPGVHPNCRCEVRLVDPMRLVQKDLRGGELIEFNDEHPRDGSGRFSAKARAQAQATLRERAEQSRTRFRPVGYADSPSPTLERMVQEAEDLRRGTLTPVEQKVSMAPNQQVSMTPKASLVPVHMPGSVSMAPKASMKAGMKQEKSTASMSAAVKQKIAMQTQTIFDQIAMTPPPAPKRKLGYRPTIKIVDYEGWNIPVYAIADEYEMDAHGNVQLTEGTVFTSNLSEIQDHASALLDARIESVTEYISYNHGNAISKNGMYAEIDTEDIWEMLAMVASQGFDPADLSKMQVHVEWHQGDVFGGPEGSRIFDAPGVVTYQEMADEWGISTDDMAVNVLRMYEGHDSSLGRTYQVEARTKRGREIWRTSGTYVSHLAPNESLVRTSFRLYDIEPDVETEYFGNHPE